MRKRMIHPNSHSIECSSRGTFPGKVTDRSAGERKAPIISSSSRQIGDLDGTGVGRYELSYMSMSVFPVAAGTTNFHALAQGNTVFALGSLNICPRVLAAIFIPKRY